MKRDVVRRYPTLRGRVLALVLVLAAMLLVLAGFSIRLVHQAAQDRARISLIGQARTLAAAVDHEFLLGFTMLQTLSDSASLARGDFDSFDREMRLAAGRFGGSAIGRVGAEGNLLLATVWDEGERPRGVPGGPTPRRALASGIPSISNLTPSQSLGGPTIGIALPVTREGAAMPAYVLATSLPRARLTALVAGDRLADDLTGVVFDRHMRLAARSGDDSHLVGQDASPSLAAAARQAAEGAVAGNAVNLRGEPVVVAFARAGLSGYIAGASVPADDFVGPIRHLMWPVLGIGLAITMTGLLAALLIGRRLRIAVGALTALGRGEAAPETGFREVEEVAATLRREAQQRRAAEEHQAVLVAELNHRVKNMLASVQSVADQTLRSAGADPRRFAEDFRGRLRSLARAHDLLTQVGWVEAELDEVLRAALAPWQGAEQQVRLEGGGDFIVSPRQAQALVLALHELATNAAKYGALSVPDGFIRLHRGPSGDGRAEILWQEVGGPRIAAPPQRRGFGTRLLERGLPTDLGQAPTITLDFAPEGLVARIVFRPAGPAAARPQQAQPAGLASTQS